MEHGKEETHFACPEIIERDGGKAVCCGCNGHECKREEQKECCEHGNKIRNCGVVGCAFHIPHNAEKHCPNCTFPPNWGCDCSCHTPQNSGDGAPDTDKQFFGAPRPAEIARMLKDSQNSGDWEGRFADTFCGEMGDYTREDYKAFIRAEIDRAERRVRGPEIAICAAVRAPDGYIVRGHRHSDAIRTMSEIPRYTDMRPYSGDQGFVTSKGRFVGRVEACQLQKAAGISSVLEGAEAYLHGELYSEDLY